MSPELLLKDLKDLQKRLAECEEQVVKGVNAEYYMKRVEYYSAEASKIRNELIKAAREELPPL